MPGQCYGCGTEFGVFKKEHGCKNCGFAFCTKCLHEKSIPVPKRNNSKHHVCVKCYKILTGKEQKEPSPAQYDLPQAYMKRVAALNERGSQGSQGVHAKPQLPHQPQKMPAHLQNLDKADRDIAMRLERLKESNKPKEKVSDKDLNARLADLKGEKHIPEKKTVYQAPDRRTQFEQVDDLLDEIAAELEIDSHVPDPVKDVEARLAHLRHGDAGGPKDESKEHNLENSDGSSSSSVVKPSTKSSAPESSLSHDGSDINMEEMQRLMEATAKELELDAQRALDGMKKDKELMERLAEIQKRKDAKKWEDDQEQPEEGASARAATEGLTVDADDSGSSDSEDVAAKKIIQRFLEESKIDEKVSEFHSQPGSVWEKTSKKQKTDRHERKASDDSDYDDEDELPFCCICNEDAIVRCKDCGLDLYCQRCFRECHQEIGLTDHKTNSYKPPKGYR